MNETKLLCEKLNRITVLTEQDKKQINCLILDFFAALLAGYKQNSDFSEKIADVVLGQGGKEESSVFMAKRKYPASVAAFMNSLYGHGAEMDDGNKQAMGHVGVHVIPAVLSLAEAEKISFEKVYPAIACGYEAYIRISAAAQPGLVNRCIHSTGMVGALACAVACAKLLELNDSQMESALSLACTMSSGLLTYTESQQMIKPINPAKAAETGVLAARFARAGVQGPYNALEGPHGWFKFATDAVDYEMLLGDCPHLKIHDCYIKLYPSCRHTHCGIDAALHIKKRNMDRNVKSVKVYIYPNAIKLAGLKFPKNQDETKFSIYYTLACALFYGEYGIDYMNISHLTQEVRELIGKIELISDESMENREKGIRGTKVTVVFEDGTQDEECVQVPKGDPENPLSYDEIVDKFKLCASDVLTEQQQLKVITYLNSISGEDYVNPEILFLA